MKEKIRENLGISKDSILLLFLGRLNRDKGLKINLNKKLDDCSGLSNEVKEILNKYKPKSIGEARELPGMTPAAAAILLKYVKK